MKEQDILTGYEAFESGDKRFCDLETKAVYESTIYLHNPATQEQLNWLNEFMDDSDIDQDETMAFGFMATVMEDDEAYSDEVCEAVENGLVKNFVFQFDAEQSGKLYVETTRELTDEETDIIKDYLEELLYNGLGDVSEIVNAEFEQEKGVDTFNLFPDAKPKTEFEFSQISLEEYQAKTTGVEDDFTKAVESIAAQKTELTQ